MDAIKANPSYRRQAAQFDREARETVARLTAQEQTTRANRIAAEQPDRTRKAAERAQRLADAWPHVKAGMTIGSIVVARKNAFSVTSTMGNRYTVEDLFGKDVARIIRERAEV